MTMTDGRAQWAFIDWLIGWLIVLECLTDCDWLSFLCLNEMHALFICCVDFSF